MVNQHIFASVVIPIYNESENIQPLYEILTPVLAHTFSSYEIIYVDDCSTDDSLAKLKDLHSRDEHIKVIALCRNFGQTAALACGFDYAKGDIIISMDGDMQHDPRDIPVLLKALTPEVDIVSGWRKHRTDPFLSRKLPSAIANLIIRKLSGVNVHDFGTTLKIYRSHIIKNINLYGGHHRFIPALARQLGAKITEVPIKNIPRKRGKSKYSIFRTFQVLLDLITIKYMLSYAHRPIYIFGFIGLILSVPGIILLGYLGVEKLIFHIHLSQHHLPLLLLSILLVVLGIQFVTFGLLGENQLRIYHEVQNKPIYIVKQVFDNYEKSINS